MKNWKTTLAGILLSSSAGMSQSDNATVKTIGLVIATIGPLLLGFFAKDSNVTGGTVPQ